MKKNSLCVCVCVCVCVRLHRGQKNIFFEKPIFVLRMAEKGFAEWENDFLRKFDI